MIHWQFYKYLLTHGIGRQYVQGNFRNDTQRTKAYNNAIKISLSFSLERFITDPSAITISSALTAVERFPFLTPDPCVAVVILPATEICGREARFCRANPFLSRYGLNSPYLIPPSTVIVLFIVSSDKILFKLLDEIRLYLLSAMALKAMPCSQAPKSVAFFYQRLNFRNRLRIKNIVRTISQVACPVF